MANIPKVTVLLPTFNGVSFLHEQLTSLNEQQDVVVEVFVNDDGSTDGTLEILEAWKAKGLIVSISQSRGLGATRAFLTLLRFCEEKEFVAFCDQDDIWVRDKLITQVNALERTIPMMSTCLRIYMDESGRVFGKSKNLRKPPSFMNSMFENIAPGNTVLINNLAVKVINSFANPPVSHYDSWIYLLISCFGKVDSTSSHLVKYRIHSSNSVGLRKKSFKASRKAIKSYLNQQSFLMEKQSEFLSTENRECLTKVSSFVKEKNIAKRIVLLRTIQIGRQSKVDEMIFRFLLIFIK
jgi:glycosyltransferase involved in cell wall biosynthesis